jgi:hypothetical protein
VTDCDDYFNLGDSRNGQERRNAGKWIESEDKSDEKQGRLRKKSKDKEKRGA